MTTVFTTFTNNGCTFVSILTLGPGPASEAIIRRHPRGREGDPVPGTAEAGRCCSGGCYDVTTFHPEVVFVDLFTWTLGLEAVFLLLPYRATEQALI